MITRLVSAGFKGLEFDEDLSAPTIFLGPNGIGKSARLEALAYALGGAVPSGRAPEIIAEYFPPDGGTVSVSDDRGRVISRGIKRSSRGKILGIFTCTEDDESKWQTDSAVLDLREFLNLSANKRREFVLGLCGAGRADAIDLARTIELAYVQSFAGAAATRETLDCRESLPDDLADLCWAMRGGGLSDEILAITRGSDRPASEICQEIADTCRTRHLAERRRAVECKAAVEELDSTIHGARASAAELERYRAAAKNAEENYSSAREESGRWQELSDEVERLRAAMADAESSLVRAKECATNLADPGPEPKIPPMPEGPSEDNADDLTLQITAIDRTLSLRTTLEAGIESARTQKEKAMEKLDAHRQHPIGRITSYCEQIPLDAHPLIKDLREAVREAGAVWEQQRSSILTEIETAGKREVEDAEELESRREQFATDEAERDRIEAELDAWRAEKKEYQAAMAGRLSAASAHAAWVEANNHRRSNEQAIEFHQKKFNATSDKLRESLVRLNAMDPPNVVELKATLDRARQNLETATESAGIVKAFTERVEQLERHQILEKAWNLAEAAAKSAREIYVSQVTEPLVEEMQSLLDAMSDGAPTMYIELESRGKKPTFEIGWILRGDRVSINALSRGQALTLCVCLSVVIARRSKGLKVLLIDATPLTEANHALLLRALDTVVDEMDAILVETTRREFDLPGDRWKVRDLAAEALVAAR